MSKHPFSRIDSIIFLENLAKFFLFVFLLICSFEIQAAGKLTFYCSAHNDTCENLAKKFEEKYDVDTKFIRQSTGAILGKIKLERQNPQADFWYGGTVEPHFQAADQGLLEAYRSPNQQQLQTSLQYFTLAENNNVLQQIQPHLQQVSQSRGEFTSIVYLMDVAIGINTDLLKQRNLNQPQCFSDLLKPEYKGLIQYPDPRVSGSGYSFLATLIQLWGEEKAFDYLKQLHKNISQYSKSGIATNRLATGEVAIEVGMSSVYIYENQKHAPLESIIPCEGVGYALGAASIIKGARNLDNAKLFMDWVLTEEGIKASQIRGIFRLPENYNQKLIQENQLKPIDIDFSRFSDEKETKRLLDKWLDIVIGE